MGKYKWEELGIPYPLEGIEPPKMIVLKMRKTTTCRGLSRLSSTLTNEKIEKKTIFCCFFSILLSLRVNQNQGVYYVKILVLDTKILIQMLSEQQLVLLTTKKLERDRSCRFRNTK